MKSIQLILYAQLTALVCNQVHRPKFRIPYSAQDMPASVRGEDSLVNTTETVVVVAGNKAKLEITVVDISLPVGVRLLFNNGSFERELGSTGIFDSFKNPGECMLWRKLDATDEWFILQRFYCVRSQFRQHALDVSFTYSLTTYPIDSRYNGTFKFKVGGMKNIEWVPYYGGTRSDHFLSKEISIVPKNWVDQNSIMTIQNSNPNYPFEFSFQPNAYWVRQGVSTDIPLFMSNFELPLFLHYKFNASSQFSLLYSLNVTQSVCSGTLVSNVLIQEASIRTCSVKNAEGQYALGITLKTFAISPLLAGEGFFAASYNTMIDEANFRMMELARASLRITSYTYACRAENKSRSTDVFPEQFGSSVFVNCAASCWTRSSNLVIGLERDSPGEAGRIRAVCDNREPRQESGPAGKIVPNCSATDSNSTEAHLLIAVFELRQFDQSLEGQYYCTVDDQGHISSYPVSIYMQKQATLSITGVASNLFESIGQVTPLTCYAVDGQPPANITWLIGGEIAKINATYYSQSLARGNSTSTLRLPMSHQYNGKDVKCQTVPYGILKSITSRPIPINFYHLPLDVPDQIIDSNSSVNVSCNIFKSNPPIDPKNCTMSTFDGRDTVDYSPIPDTPIIVDPGQSFKVHCRCKYGFYGSFATSQTMIYVNWKGAVDLVMEAKIMRYLSVYVLATISGLAALLIVTLLILRLRGYSLDGPPLPDAILSKLALGGEVVISRTMSTTGRSQIMIKHRPSGIAAGGASVDPYPAWRSGYELASGVAAESAAAPSMRGTAVAMLVSRGTMTLDGDFSTRLRRTASGTSSRGSAVFGGKRKRRASATPEEAIAQAAAAVEAQAAAKEKGGRTGDKDRDALAARRASTAGMTAKVMQQTSRAVNQAMAVLQREGMQHYSVSATPGGPAGPVNLFTPSEAAGSGRGARLPPKNEPRAKKKQKSDDVMTAKASATNEPAVSEI